MTTIDVTPERTTTGWQCAVRVLDERSASEHSVYLSTGDLERLDPRATDPTDLVRRSFEFMLEREPKESILGSFDLSVIGRYFPDYERTIRAGL
jgi:hypothetical protein